MPENKKDILYSDQVTEIISNPPKRLIRWGTAVIASVFFLLLVLAWVLRYPDIVPATIEITTSNPPVTLFSKITGRINKLYVTDGENVSKGRLLAVMETAASIDEFKALKALTDSIGDPSAFSPQHFPAYSGLGEIQTLYAGFLKSLSEYRTYISNDLYGTRINSMTEEISALQEYISNLKAKESLVAGNLELAERKFKRDSSLFIKKVLAESDFENSKQAYAKSRMELQDIKLEQSSKTIELAQKRQTIQDYRVFKEGEEKKLASALNESWQNLLAGMRMWEIKYLLVSPVDGTVSFTKYWSENQSVNTDEPVLSLVPKYTGEIIGRLTLSMQRSGKVKTGQDVKIKLSGYPYLEYGMIEGEVKSKSLVPSGNSYIIEVSLPQDLTTRYGIKLEFTQNMQGRAEIETDSLRLLQKIINPFRYIITRNRD